MITKLVSIFARVIFIFHCKSHPNANSGATSESMKKKIVNLFFHSVVQEPFWDELIGVLSKYIRIPMQNIRWYHNVPPFLDLQAINFNISTTIPLVTKDW